MGETGAGVLLGLLLGFLPAALLVLALAAIVVVVAGLFALARLLDQPPSAWFCALSLAFNVVVLTPLGAVSWLAASYRPAVWEQADGYVYAFAAAFIVPTVVFAFMWAHAAKRDRDG